MYDLSIVKDNQVVDPAIQSEIIRLAIAGNFGDSPSQAIHFLGNITLPDDRKVKVHLRHAVDAIMVDPYDHVVLITRKYNPGAGLLACPGGFIDPLSGKDGQLVVENALEALFREAGEETGISRKLLERAKVIPLGHRSYNRPFDVRFIWRDMEGTDIKLGDFCLVSTQGFCIFTQQDLSRTILSAGDDADIKAGIKVPKISMLKPELMGIPDHYPMILAAKKTAAPYQIG
jgi:ADP-ribose pyrophosphatase YjhB (NUDIX family)